MSSVGTTNNAGYQSSSNGTAIATATSAYFSQSLPSNMPSEQTVNILINRHNLKLSPMTIDDDTTNNNTTAIATYTTTTHLCNTFDYVKYLNIVHQQKKQQQPKYMILVRK